MERVRRFQQRTVLTIGCLSRNRSIACRSFKPQSVFSSSVIAGGGARFPSFRIDTSSNNSFADEFIPSDQLFAMVQTRSKDKSTRSSSQDTPPTNNSKLMTDEVAQPKKRTLRSTEKTTHAGRKGKQSTNKDPGSSRSSEEHASDEITATTKARRTTRAHPWKQSSGDIQSLGRGPQGGPSYRV